MRFNRLDLIAFGPFSDRTIDLSRGKSGLHIVFGPNESGKSSALRALKNFLFGIPVRTTDDFIHRMDRLRIGAELVAADGSHLRLIRKKGSKNTLLDAGTESPVDDSVITRLISGLDLRQYELFFALDHDALVEGGRALLDSSQDVGQILFSAGASIGSIEPILAALDGEAAALFTRTGRNQVIPQSIARLAELRGRLKELELPQSSWQKHEGSYNEALARQKTLEDELAAQQKELNRLERVASAVPTAAALVSLRARLAEFSPVVLLPDSFADDVRDALNRRANAESGSKHAASAIESLERQLSAMDEPGEILKHEKEVEAAARDLAIHQKADEDRKKREFELAQREKEAGEILTGLGQGLNIDDCQSLRVSDSQRIRLRELMQSAQGAEERAKSARQALADARRELDEAESRLASLPPAKDASDLKREIGHARLPASMEGELAEQDTQLRTLKTRIKAGIAKLSLGARTEAQITCLPVPLMETIERYRLKLDQAGGEIAGLELRLTNERQTLSRKLSEIEALASEMDVPSEGELASLRKERDAAWSLIKSVWLSGERDDEAIRARTGGAPGDHDLASAFEKSMLAADATSDRLRRESERVGRKASLVAQKAEIEESIRAGELAVAQAQVLVGDLEAEWQGIWAETGVEPRSPAEMAEWRRNFDWLLELTSKAAEIETEASRRRQSISEAAAALTEAIKVAGLDPPEKAGSLSRLLQWAQDRSDELASQAQMRAALADSVARLSGQVKKLEGECLKHEEALSDWKRDWAQAVSPLGLAPGASSAQAQAHLDKSDRLFEILADRKNLIHRIDAIKRDTRDYTEKLVALAALVAPDLRVERLGATVDELSYRLQAARQLKADREAIASRITDQRKLLEQNAALMEEAAASLARMCAQARVTSPDDLINEARRSADYQHTKKRLDELEDQLLPLCAGLTVDAFIQQVEETDIDSLPYRIDSLKQSIAAVRSELAAINQTIGSERSELARMNGSGDAAETAEQVQLELAKLRQDAEQYARLKLAAAILRRAVERYREKNQSPVLRRASELFALITRGSFSALASGEGDEQASTIVGVRPHGQTAVPIAGMSEGTRDQLYLALRLAVIESTLTGKEPVPFVVDDILVNFDDERALAALSALCRLARTTQVIFFTHHEHLLDLVEKKLPADDLFVHRLDRVSAAV